MMTKKAFKTRTK
jgi:hypothetical protein